jgi:hypothetical protein
LNSVFGLERVARWNPIKTSSIQSSAAELWMNTAKFHFGLSHKFV